MVPAFDHVQGRGIDLIQKARGVDSDLDSGLRLDLPANAFR